MHNSNVLALALGAALVRAEFISPSRGDNLEVNEAVTIRWETNGLQEPISINLVPAGPDDFVVAQEVALDIDNTGELEFIPDASIAAFDAFQLVLSDSAGNTFNSDSFEIDGLSDSPVEATVTITEFNTARATGADGAVVTNVEPNVRQQVASVPNGPIRLFVSGSETVNEQIATPVFNAAVPTQRLQAQDDDEDDDDGIQIQGGIAQNGGFDFNPGALTTAPGRFIPATAPDDLTRTLNIAPSPAGQLQAPPPANLGGAGAASPVQFAPVATSAVAVVTAVANTLAAPPPAQAIVPTVQVGAQGVINPASPPVAFTPLTAANVVETTATAPGAVTAADAAVGGGFTPLNIQANAPTRSFANVTTPTDAAAGVDVAGNQGFAPLSTAGAAITAGVGAGAGGVEPLGNVAGFNRTGSGGVNANSLQPVPGSFIPEGGSQLTQTLDNTLLPGGPSLTPSASGFLTTPSPTSPGGIGVPGPTGGLRPQTTTPAVNTPGAGTRLSSGNALTGAVVALLAILIV